MKSFWLCFAGTLVVCLPACGSDDDDGGSGGSAGTASGGASGSAAGGAMGGAAGGGRGGAAGGAGVCSATTNPYDPATVDCTTACNHFTDYQNNDGCANPYADVLSSCIAGCDTIKGTTTYSNALFGCAAEQTTCASFNQCVKDKCG